MRSVLGMAVAVVTLHLIGWGTLLLVAASGNYVIQGSVFGIGLGVTAYTLGVRHAFDADHIAAIDNTVRKLLGDNDDRQARTVGFWFALGHSTVVFVLVVLLAAGMQALAATLENEDSSLLRWTDLWGAGVSGLFLIAIGLLNFASLVGLWRLFRKMRRGEYDEAQLHRQLDNRGLLNRVLRPVLGLVRKPRHMYPVGVLFGLGFDTVTEVGLLVIAGGAVATGLPWYAILVLPVLFAAGMTLFDALDGALMSLAYDWAFVRPVRKIYYNLVVTGLSVVVALLIGGQGIVSIVVERLGIESGVMAWVGGLDLGELGYIIVGLLLFTWAVALAVWRFADVERRWEDRIAVR